MIHVKQIREFVEAGDSDAAHAHLDTLLELGPHNVEALKLRAKLYEYEGAFDKEFEIWKRITDIDNEDGDAIQYILQRQLEDREHFYFTDDLNGGGRRFLAYPKQMLYASFVGLIGCLLFLTSLRLSTKFPILGDSQVVLGAFSLLVLVPWMTIIYSLVTSIRSVSVTQEGILVQTRFRRHMRLWKDIDDMFLTRCEKRKMLKLVIKAKDSIHPPIIVNLEPQITAIRARSYLVKEISHQWEGLPFRHWPESLNGKVLTF